jgi:hypothetical protein
MYAPPHLRGGRFARPNRSWAAVCGALAALGVLRIGILHLGTEGGWRLPWKASPTIDERWEPIRAALPPGRTLGYVSMECFAHPTDDRRYLQAGYALAPRVLVRDAPTAFVVADVSSASDLDLLCERRSLEKVVVLDNGVALLRRRSGP